MLLTTILLLISIIRLIIVITVVIPVSWGALRSTIISIVRRSLLLHTELLSAIELHVLPLDLLLADLSTTDVVSIHD